MEKTRVLFVCVHNAARSQMAEAFMNHLCGDSYEAESAGLEPTEVNPLVIEAMKVVGIDISGNMSKSVFNFSKRGGSTVLLSPYVMRPMQNGAPSFPASPPSFTGLSRTLLHLLAVLRNDLPKSGRPGIV